MNQLTKKLGLITLVLFVISLTTYYFDNRRGSADIAGTDLIAGLNVEKLQGFSVKTSSEEFKFQKENESFLLISHQGFTASNERVNDLLYKLASIKIREKKPITETSRNINSMINLQKS